MGNRTRTVGEFVITEFEREVTNEQLQGIEADNVFDAENLMYISEHRKVECVRVEHRSGIWAIEVPVYNMLYHTVMSFGDDLAEQIALGNLLLMVMENSTIIGDEKYIRDSINAKKELRERSENMSNK